MSVLQSVHLLSVNGQPVNTIPDQNFPGIAPTAASPCPIFGLSNKHIQGVSVPTAAQVASFPPAQAVVYINYQNGNQRFTGTILTSETAAAIISAGA